MTPDNPVRIGCTLDPADVPGRLDEWADIRSRADDVQALPDGVRLTLPPDTADAVRDLADRERACCGFLDIGVTASADRVEIEIRSSDPAGRAVVEQLSGVRIPPAPIMCCAPTPTGPTP